MAENTEKKRSQNERKFKDWEPLTDGGRRYRLEIVGKSGWKARYVKEVDSGERTVRFYQEIYDEQGQLVEVHEKYPEDKGHRRIRR